MAKTSNRAIQEAKNSDEHENIGLIEAARDYLEKIKFEAMFVFESVESAG